MLTRPSLVRFLVLIVLIALLGVLTLLAPEEATLGANMRWVYLHVSFSWAGTSLINLAGLTGIYLLFRPDFRVSRWIAPAQATGLLLFGMGFVLSLVASWTSWGGILWMEPRVLSSIAILAGGVGVVLIMHSLINPRMIGILAIAFSTGIGLLLGSTGRIFHPEDPIDASESSMIRLTFYALTLLAIAAGVVLTMIIKDKAVPKGTIRPV